MQNDVKESADEVSQDPENRELTHFAAVDCDLLTQKKRAVSWKSVAQYLILVPFKAIGYLVFLPCWRQHVTLAEIRRFRDTFLSNPKQKRGHTGFFVYYFINWLAWHTYRHIQKLDLNMDDGRHAWEIIQEVWSRTVTHPDGDFFHLFAELRPRTFEAFLNRDKTFFLSRNGDIFTRNAKEILFYVLILSHKGNRFVRLLYSWACALIERKSLNLEKKKPIVQFLFEDQERRMMQIKNIRRGVLECIEQYACNMLRDTLDHGDTETAAGWNDVICRVRDLKGFRPQADNLGQLSSLVTEMVACFNAAAQRTYVMYRVASPSLPAPADASVATETAADGEVQAEIPTDPKVEIKVYGRFRVEIGETHYRITDTKLKERPYKIKKGTHAGDAVRQLLLNYDTGTDQTHQSSSEWDGAFQRGRGDATRFKNDEIFKLPRWDAEKGKYLLGQYAGLWRLWLDGELAFSKKERVQRFMNAHPKGLPT